MIEIDIMSAVPGNIVHDGERWGEIKLTTTHDELDGNGGVTVLWDGETRTEWYDITTGECDDWEVLSGRSGVKSGGRYI